MAGKQSSVKEEEETVQMEGDDDKEALQMEKNDLPGSKQRPSGVAEIVVDYWCTWGPLKPQPR